MYCKWVIKFLRKLKKHIYGFVTSKKLENIKKAGRCVNNCKFVKDSLIRATLFKGKVQQCVGK